MSSLAMALTNSGSKQGIRLPRPLGQLGQSSTLALATASSFGANGSRRHTLWPEDGSDRALLQEVARAEEHAPGSASRAGVPVLGFARWQV